ncbi:uncharacterized protein LOC115734924 [Rhodamnia argentea]|uniref:Uncharacterized protein LOC115734924 n=1 Tax=Rhodamnia argentea TaxID=178133 RepID=A0A8B8NH45_9MYRT|nr:uncharacterized protein LOC115734924 [Rhodamnia argentea]XP_048137635.1 uncharacterized protein LOC115734924 [Rhodamnia argentea]
MVLKRPFDDGESYEVSYKLPRREEHSPLHALPGIDSSEHSSLLAESPGEGWSTKRKLEVDQKLIDGCVTKPPISNVEDAYNSEEFQLEGRLRASFSPEYVPSNHPATARSGCDDVYSLVLRHPPQKPVPIGPDYQADLSPWSQQDAMNSLSCLNESAAISNSDLIAGDEDDRRFTGICVIPFPASDVYDNCDDKVGAGRAGCSCLDEGSIRCSRQHTMEARDLLRRELGNEGFVESGCHDMGEQVAEKWSDEEEQLFHEIVFSNPSSWGRNFWNSLSFRFPSRTRREIVSYYFNVYMLQKRAEQNRCDPVNIDSDNDEWQVSDEEDEDSIVESPEHGVGPGYDRNVEEINEVDEGIAEETCEGDEHVTLKVGEFFSDSPEACSKKWTDSPTSHLRNKSWDDRGDQDDSCTSFDSLAATVPDTQLKRENGDCLPSSSHNLNGGGGHDYVLDTCDAKFWDAGYIACPKTEFEFLPTCSMIEEVFGDGSWNSEADGKGFS